MNQSLDPISIALFAEISARVDGGESRLMVLAEKSVSEQFFQQEQQRWLQEMVTRAEAQRWELQQRFAAIYARWRVGDVPTTLTRLRDREQQPTSHSASVSLQEYATASTPPGVSPGSVSSYHPSSSFPPQQPAAAFAPPIVASAPPSSFPPQQPAAAFAPPAVASAPPVVAPALPVVAPALPAAAALSLEQLACLAAEVDVAPSAQAAALEGYRLDAQSYAAQRAALSQQFAADPDLEARFNHLFQYYRGVLSTR